MKHMVKVRFISVIVFLSRIFFLHLEMPNKIEAPPRNTPLLSNEKRSRRKPAFSHQVCCHLVL